MKYIREERKKIIYYLTVVMFLIIAFISTISNEELKSLNEWMYMYYADELIGVTDNSNFVNEVSKENQAGKLEVVPTLAQITQEKSRDLEKIYIRQNLVNLVEGYILNIDEKEYYIKEKEDYEWAKKYLVSSNIPLEEAKKTYYSTGEVPVFNYDNRQYIDILVSSQVKITKDLVDESQLIEEKEKLLFTLTHLDSDPKYDKVVETDTYRDFLLRNKLTNKEFEINNPNYNRNTLYFSNQELVVNEVNSNIDVKVIYNEKVKENVKYRTIYKDDKTLEKGKTKVSEKGSNGVRNVTKQVTTVNDVVVNERVIEEDVITPPKNRVILKGTKATQSSLPGSSGGRQPEGPTTPTGPIDSSGQFAWPGSSKNVICGWYCYPGHAAIDIQSWYGAPIYAADGGTVTVAGYEGGYGWHVMINHGNGYTTVYGHMSGKPTVSAGSGVSKGQHIGNEGESGYAFGEHLHFEIRYNGQALNPLNFY